MQMHGWKRTLLSNQKTEVAQPFRAEPNVEDKSARARIPQQLWVSCIKDETDVMNPIQTKVELSYAVAVMDNIVGWHEEGESTEVMRGLLGH